MREITRFVRAARWLRAGTLTAMGLAMKLIGVLVLICCPLSFGCSRSKPANDAGPAQKAGAVVDQGARDTKESAKEAGKKIGEATEKAGDKMQEKSGD